MPLVVPNLQQIGSNDVLGANPLLSFSETVQLVKRTYDVYYAPLYDKTVNQLFATKSSDLYKFFIIGCAASHKESDATDD